LFTKWRAANCLATLACLLCGARPSHAQGASREVRLDYGTQPSRLTTLTVTRLTAELRVAGFSIAEPPGADTPETEADGVEPAPTGYASIVILIKGARIQLEITSRAQGASSHVVLVGTEREVGALALQATEFLRAGLLPRLEPPAEPLRAAAPRVSETPTKPVRRGRVFTELGAALLHDWGARDALPLLSLGGGYVGASGLALSGNVQLPLRRARFEATAGSADYRIWLGQIQADFAWFSWATGRATVGLSVGAARVTATGRPSPPNDARSPEAWAVTLGARLGADQELTPHVSAFCQVRALGLSPNPLVTVLSDERRLGSPSLVVELGARIGN